jgi:hypothetical protein
MEWTADVSAGEWLRERIDAVMPRGFDAYARIFHPATRDRPVGVPWPSEPYALYHREWDAFHSAQPEIDEERVTWTDTAAAFGTTIHPLAQWNRIVGRRTNEGDPVDAAGWRYSDPPNGTLDPGLLAAVAGTLADYTATPDDGFVALWDGWGGVLGGMGYGPSRVLYATADDTPADPRHDDFLAHASRDMFNDVFRKPTWQPGILSDEISRGPRLSLPDRDHVLFRAGVTELADADWVLRAPWRDTASEAHGFPPSAESPSLVWPADRSWVLVTEIDFDSTIVAGSSELIRALCADDGLEALPIPEGADLTWNGDEVNR